MTQYTAVSFAPVQGFIEKSRKLRDLFGASLILSYLSQQLAEAADRKPELAVISPALINVQEGTPNRILVQGLFERNDVTNVLLASWAKILDTCREWIEQNVPDSYCWLQEWKKWQQYTWEIFWGVGETPDAAMRDLGARKLKRAWTGINWTGESSSLTGTDAIAAPYLGQVNSDPGRSLDKTEKEAVERFYRQLAYVLDDPYQRSGKVVPAGIEPEGKFIAASERLSIPELAKRLVTLPILARKIGMTDLGDGFQETSREVGDWTGWFMGDGDKVGNKLKDLTSNQQRQAFSLAMREWGQSFKDSFPKSLGRVIYAGGDDFLGVLYRSSDQKIEAVKAFEWLKMLNDQWQQHKQSITLSLGFVWVGHAVPQRDILQHCREAERRAKSLGRDRVTLRVVFNSGQFVQWTCPWDHLGILTQYRDRDGNQNWTHIYQDWSHLKARHAVRLKETDQIPTDAKLALALLDFYFNNAGQSIQQQHGWLKLAGDDSPGAIVQWIDDLVQVGWQLCSNT